MKFIYFTLGLASLWSICVNAGLTGSANITPQDYIGLPAAALATNPPACGMPYATLDLSRITAVQNLNAGTDCNKCIKVVNTKDPSKFVYVLAVDLGGSGLDLSIPSFKKLFGQQYDASPASWSETNYSNCAGIYSKGASPSSGKPKPTSTTIKQHTTTTHRPATTTITHAKGNHTRKPIRKPTTHSKPKHTHKSTCKHTRHNKAKPTRKPNHHPKNKKKSTASRRKHHHHH
ncbi:uncharacterized protein BX664DRAFT_331606 [Halteromyces radiatus]|uniref:uncharacterized protein n=1 Tax=Halteromyces radiatus TaxID=101107 RepID=UPI00221FEF7C|nr:uncharacterized protein BX664DRAFT_331606 [Halteromyces radiatus]KAI8088866.1 hypothetical protein BX664DRAFT_331606 [Halteromyces radiatus]